jgi:hypothetical protein
MYHRTYHVHNDTRTQNPVQQRFEIVYTLSLQQIIEIYEFFVLTYTLQM